MSAADLMNSAMQLPQAQRAALARRLLLSLEPDDFDADSADAWEAEIEARLAKVESGKFKAHDWRDALAQIRQKLAEGQSRENTPAG